MLAKFLLITLASVNAFFNPSVRLSSGKTASITGKGPPILFSTGLFGTMPNHMYGNIMNELKKNMTLSTINDNYQINIILESDKLCYPKQESANALLKILEEPPHNSTFILVTSKSSFLLDTIKSRCIKQRQNE